MSYLCSPLTTEGLDYALQYPVVYGSHLGQSGHFARSNTALARSIVALPTKYGIVIQAPDLSQKAPDTAIGCGIGVLNCQIYPKQFT